ncbi:carbon-nitrogen hydrolase [Rhodopirellula maiorica SM1]|uniref:Carbon-nitrogen hydrolase n=1 Tax=Rhodopirellula maiorica SM1 TaxID=1265738 RepID=M5S2J1_9BACT|nr:nitrilase family protein [Rhodopirellula maiorica]EMI20399.1 carbon-nitrogen hydrolase [Rhodopirellula maiorica SM1]
MTPSDAQQETQRRLRVASVQFEASPADKLANFAKIETFLRQAAEQGVRLVVFPECCITGYWFIRNLSLEQLGELAEPIPNGPSTQRLVELARRYNISIGAGLVEVSESGEFYNSYVVALPDGTIHCHRKLQAFEHAAIRSGTEYTVFDLPDGFRVGVLICYDCNLIENVRITALRGAEILLAPHQTGAVRSKNPNLMGIIDRQLWDNRHAAPEAIEKEFRGDKGRGWLMRWLPSRAHDNGIFLVFSNGVGVDDDEIRTGNAMILDPYGRVIAETWKADDAMVVADLDAGLLADATGRGWIRARRPELYTPLTVPTGLERDTREMKFDE